ncbi:MAG TPA: 50S ribosomal protein L1 [Acidimicrobiales bacterium]
MQRGKKFTDAEKRFDGQALHSAIEAVDLVKSLAPAKFDETVELAVRLGVDPRKADQMIRGTVSLPAGTGKNVRVAVFAAGTAAEEARAAGADIVGADDLVARVQAGDIDWDKSIATPDMMALVGRVGRILGPRQLMPNPKEGTVTPDVGKAVTEVKGGRVTYRTDRYGNVHVLIGKVSFDNAALLQNFRAVIDELTRVKPAAAKGKYIRSVTASSTMGPGVRVDPARIRATDEELAAAAS